MSKINFTGIFSHYQPIDFEPHYVFTTDKRYFIKCIDYPSLISTLSPQDLVNIEGEIAEHAKDGIRLVNVKFGSECHE